MAVSFNPKCYYPDRDVEEVVGMWLVFNQAYVPTISISDLLMTINDWSNNPKDKLTTSCLTFLSISDKSKVFPPVGSTLYSWTSPWRG